MKKVFRKRWVWLVILIAIIGVWRWRVNANRAKNGEKERVVRVEKRDIVFSLVVSGDIKAEKEAVLNFPVAGKLGYLGVKEGDEVKRGKVLATLDLGDLEAFRTKAYYSYLAADAYAKKIEDEVKGHDKDETFTQKYNRVSAQTDRDEAYETWLSARRAVDNARLIAPFGGVITKVTVNAVGDTVGITDGMTIVDPKTIYFEGEVDEVDIGMLSKDPKIQIFLDAFEEASFSGRLENIGFVSKLSSTGATVYPVKIKIVGGSLDFAQDKLRLGMNGDAQIILAEKKNVLALPIEAVVDGKVTKKNGEVSQVDVKTGLEGDEYIEIISGLNDGEQVIIK